MVVDEVVRVVLVTVSTPHLPAGTPLRVSVQLLKQHPVPTQVARERLSSLHLLLPDCWLWGFPFWPLRRPFLPLRLTWSIGLFIRCPLPLNADGVVPVPHEALAVVDLEAVHRHPSSADMADASDRVRVHRLLQITNLCPKYRSQRTIDP